MVMILVIFEIRLHSYSGNSSLNIKIRNNIISGNDEDGIQLIDYPGMSNRIFYIENNLIVNNSMAGLGCMANGNTSENYEGAAIPESIYLINNTISGNDYGVTGGANLTAYNNVIVNSVVLAMKNVKENSLISYSIFWNNGQNFDHCNIDDQSLIFSDPLFVSGSDYHIQDTSPCIRSGTAIGVPLTDIEYIQRGNPPDIGAYENISDRDQSLPVELKSFNGNYFNGNIELIWVTTSELNNLGYEIYVKEGKQNEFKLLADYSEDYSLMGLGNSSQGKQYNYIHQNVNPGTNYYYKLSPI